jgi:hypothetical protein
VRRFPKKVDPRCAIRIAIVATLAACGAVACNDWGTTTEVRPPTDDTVCTQWQSHVDHPIQLRPAVLLHGIQVTFRDSSGADIHLGNDCALDFLSLSMADSTVALVTRDLGLRWYFNILTLKPGSTTLEVSLWQNDAINFTSQAIPVVVAP